MKFKVIKNAHNIFLSEKRGYNGICSNCFFLNNNLSIYFSLLDSVCLFLIFMKQRQKERYPWQGYSVLWSPSPFLPASQDHRHTWATLCVQVHPGTLVSYGIQNGSEAPFYLHHMAWSVLDLNDHKCVSSSKGPDKIVQGYPVPCLYRFLSWFIITYYDLCSW